MNDLQYERGVGACTNNNNNSDDDNEYNNDILLLIIIPNVTLTFLLID